MSILEALELLGEHSTVKHATVALRLETDAAVDAMFDDIGPAVDETGKRVAGNCPPTWQSTEDRTAWWREAAVTVAGVRVIISGPIQVGRKAA